MSKSRNRKHKRSRKHSGGSAAALQGAMVKNASFVGGLDDWSSKMSAGHGGDFLKYHVGQHGGSALAGAPLSAVSNSALDAHLRGSAMLGGLDRAFSNIAGLRDQAGGRRKHRTHKHRTHKHHSRKHTRKHTHKHHSRKHSRKNTRKHGGSRRKANTHRRRHQGGAMALEFAPLSSPSMLPVDHAKAGLSVGWKSGVEFDAAAARARV